jgi:hypothetical protein
LVELVEDGVDKVGLDSVPLSKRVNGYARNIFTRFVHDHDGRRVTGNIG